MPARSGDVELGAALLSPSAPEPEPAPSIYSAPEGQEFTASHEGGDEAQRQQVALAEEDAELTEPEPTPSIYSAPEGQEFTASHEGGDEAQRQQVALAEEDAELTEKAQFARGEYGASDPRYIELVRRLSEVKAQRAQGGTARPAERWGVGDMLLVAFFALVGAALLGASLVPGWEAYNIPGDDCTAGTDGHSAARGFLERMLGATAMLTRFGGFLFAFLLDMALSVAGYDGVGLVRSVMAPRLAAIDTAGIKNARQEAEAAVPEAAGWYAIAGNWGGLVCGNSGVDAPSTWTEAREALGLSVRQAVWSCGSKLLLWHWAQPLSYFFVAGIYFCSCESPWCSWVAYREVAYVLSTLLALWLNPAYLLLELDPVLKPTEEGEGRRVDWQAAKAWAGYLLAPHHYVTACLMRWARSVGRGCVDGLLRMVVVLQVLADLCSAIALGNLLVDSSPPAALAIGWWLTTAGLVVAVGGVALASVGLAWRGEDHNGEARGCCDRVVATVLSLVFRVVATVLSLVFGCGALYGAGLLVLAPLELSGATRGLAALPCDAWYCDIYNW